MLFLGDSITEDWRGTDLCEPCSPTRRSACDAVPAVFSKTWGRRRALALGIGGDQVAHLMWRLQNGHLPRRNQVGGVELDGVQGRGRGGGEAARCRGQGGRSPP